MSTTAGQARTEWIGGILVNHETPQCPCETNGRTTAACHTHGPADTAAAPVPKGWE